MNFTDASSIGIIGGADGLTAVFVTGNPFPLILIGVPILLLLVGSAIAAVLHFRK